MKPGDVVLCVKPQFMSNILEQVFLIAPDWQLPVVGKTYIVDHGCPCCSSRINLRELPDGSFPTKSWPYYVNCSICDAILPDNTGFDATSFIKISGDDTLTEDEIVADYVNKINQSVPANA